LSQVSWTTWPIWKAEPGEAEPGLDTMAEAVAALGNEITSVPERPEAYYHRRERFSSQGAMTMLSVTSHG